MRDMNEKIFESTDYGKAALLKFGDCPDNFRIFEAGMIDDNSKVDNGIMFVKGACFRVAKSGPNKGKLSILIPNTTLKTFVTREEILAQSKS